MKKIEAVRIILELCEKFDLYTKSPSTRTVIKRFNEENGEVYVILTSGEPSEINQCSECKENLRSEEFSYYQARVRNDGYLGRHNALCTRCKKMLNSERQQVLKSAEEAGEIPPKPKPGERCPYCDRAWKGKWHRHHNPKTDQFIAWYCGNCNMALQDRRNRQKKENEVGNENQ